MRVAITDFHAQSRRNRACNIWTPHTHIDPQLDPDFSSNAAPLTSITSRLLRRAGWLFDLDPRRLAVCFASSKGQIEHFCPWVQSGENWPFPDGEARQIAKIARAQGPILCPVAACASGAHALALGAGLIEAGRAEVVLAGASEPPQPEIILAAYRNMGALSKSGVMRPFDVRRDGFVPASGGALFVLESEAHARARNAQIYGFLSGYSLRCDAHHMTSMHPGGDGIARAIEDALQKAGHPQIDYINAHGTATINDAIEARAIRAVFGDKVPISSTKALTGHLLGAAGAVEAAICLLAMRNGLAPPTLNLDQPDEALGLDCIPLHPRPMAMNAVLSLNYGFGGQIGALIFEKP